MGGITRNKTITKAKPASVQVFFKLGLVYEFIVIFQKGLDNALKYVDHLIKEKIKLSIIKHKTKQYFSFP